MHTNLTVILAIFVQIVCSFYGLIVLACRFDVGGLD
jgi:hypothetical protein